MEAPVLLYLMGTLLIMYTIKRIFDYKVDKLNAKDIEHLTKVVEFCKSKKVLDIPEKVEDK